MNAGELPQLLPHDEHNCELKSNVHPKDWRNPTPTQPYHLVVLGAGTAGLVTAAGAAGLGARVALIERDLMGGDCLNVGCVPSKGLIGAARIAASVREAGSFGVSTGNKHSVDFARVMQRMRRLRAKISPADSAKRFSELGVDVFFGQGSFVDDRTIQVTERDGKTLDLRYKKAVLATGARAAAPEIPGLETVDYLTNETLFSLTELPKRLGVIGAGPIGTEMAQAFARFGSDVVLFDRNDRVLAREDPEAGAIIAKSLERDGVRLMLGSRDIRILPTSPWACRIQTTHHGKSSETVVDRLLVAVGRVPNLEGLNLDAVDVEHDKHGVIVNDFLQTTNPRLYAAGDLCSKEKFTHAADFQARIVIQNALFRFGPFGRKRASRLIIPRATYTSPEVAHVGTSLADAEQSGIAVDTYYQDLADVDRAILEGQDHGFVKVHTKKGTDTIVGATIVAENAGDLISEITVAMNAGLGLSKIGATIHPYPTQAEAIRKLGDQFNRTKLTPTNKRLLGLLRTFNVGK